MHKVFVTDKGQGAMGRSRKAAATTGRATCMRTGRNPFVSTKGADAANAGAMTSSVATESRSLPSEGPWWTILLMNPNAHPTTTART